MQAQLLEQDSANDVLHGRSKSYGLDFHRQHVQLSIGNCFADGTTDKLAQL